MWKGESGCWYVLPACMSALMIVNLNCSNLNETRSRLLPERLLEVGWQRENFSSYLSAKDTEDLTFI